jgi:DNA-binding NtrC family response regulator
MGEKMPRKKEQKKMSPYLQHYLDLKKVKESTYFPPSLEELKQEYISYLLDLTGNRIKETANILNISHVSLQHKLSRQRAIKNHSFPK